MNNDIIKLKEIIKNSNNIVFLGGAGVSTESGLKDFKGEMDYINKNMINKQNIT